MKDKLDMVMKDGKKVPFYAADGKGEMKKGGKVKKTMPASKPKKMMGGGGVMKKGYAAGGMMAKMKSGGGVMSKMKHGGGVSKRADGVATKGKTKGKMI